MADKLQSLYDKLIEAFNSKLSADPTAADLAQIRQFLKDQDYSATSAHEGLSELGESIEKLDIDAIDLELAAA